MMKMYKIYKKIKRIFKYKISKLNIKMLCKHIKVISKQ